MRIRRTKNSNRGICKKRGNFKRALQSQWQNRGKKPKQTQLFHSEISFRAALGISSRPFHNVTLCGPHYCLSNFYPSFACSIRHLIKTISCYLYMCVHRHTWITFLIKAFKHCCDSNNSANNGLTSSGH